jgi:hypothetical protein
MFAKWTDDMVRDYFDTHWNATLHEVCALSGRSKSDVKSVLMDEAQEPVPTPPDNWSNSEMQDYYEAMNATCDRMLVNICEEEGK